MTKAAEALPPISHKAYTSAIRKELGTLYDQIKKPDPLRLIWLPINVLIFVAGLYITAHNHGGILGKILASLAIGNAFASLGFLGHEVMHNAVVRKNWVKHLVGAIAFSPFWLGTQLWRLWHNEMHHNHTQHPDDDPDTSATLAQYQQRPVLRLFYRVVRRNGEVFFPMLSVWFAFQSHRMLWTIQKRKPHLRPILLVQWLLPLAAWISLLFIVGPKTYFWVYVLPFFISGFVVMAYISTNHLLNPQMAERDELQGTLSVRVPWFFDVWHLGFGHHVEHHLFPAISHKWSWMIRAVAKSKWPDRFHEMSIWQALILLWKTPRLYLDHDHLVDPNDQRVFPTLGRGLTPDKV